MLRKIVDTPWVTKNSDFHGDLEMGLATNEIQDLQGKQEEGLHHRENIEIIQLLDNSNMVPRQKRRNLLWAS